MKLTTHQLKRIIMEEFQRVMQEVEEEPSPKPFKFVSDPKAAQMWLLNNVKEKQ